MQIINFRPPRIGMLLVFIATAAHLFSPGLSNFMPSSPVLGGVLALVGFSTMISAWWLFKKEDVAICPTAHTDRFLTGGVYSFSRNPMYLGMVLMVLGLAVCIGSLPFYLATAGYFSVLNFIFCPYEEGKLKSVFGQEFLDYQTRVRRWL